MTFLSIGDLAQSLQMRRDTGRISGDLQRLSTELSTGRKAELTKAVSGDFGPLAAIDRDLSALTASELVAKEAVVLAQASETVLARMAEDAKLSSNALLLSPGTEQPILVDKAAADTRTRFQAAIAGLNTQVAGRSLFSGQAVTDPAFVDAETILADLFTAVSGAVDANDALAQIDLWFGPGGGFETASYTGSPVAEEPVRLGDGSTAQPTLQGTDARIRETVKPLATAALLDMGLLAGQPEERAGLARAAGEALLTSATSLTGARGRIGESQAAAERAQARISAERNALERARSEITDADPFETANKLRTAETQLQTLYLLTGRLADLSLTNFLR